MKVRMVLNLLLSLVLALVLVDRAAAAPQRFELNNGITVVTSENHEAPVVAFQVWVRAGSAYEQAKEFGITHLIEHMIFKGTPKNPAGTMARKVEALGGEINAYTTFDHTNYYVVAASRNAAEALDLLADAVAHAQFDPKDLAAEKEVVIEEIRMNRDDPDRWRGKQVFIHAFGDHPYGHPIIGSQESVRAMTRQDILNYTGRWYRGPGVLLVAVGDFDTNLLLPQVEKAFASFSDEAPPPFEVPGKKPYGKPQLQLMEQDVRQAAVEVSWLIPGLPSEEVYALDMAATVLGEGETSRLYSELKEKRGLVDDIDAGAFTPEKVGLMRVTAQMPPEKVNQAWPAILAQCLELATHPPSPEELNRARVNLEADFIRSRQTMEGQARLLGYFEFFRGGFEQEAAYLARFNTVGSDEVSRAVRKYLTPDRLSMVIQAPPGTKLPTAEEVDRKAAELMKGLPPAETDTGGAVRKVLANGLTLIIKPAHAVPTVSLVLASPGGRIFETPADAGLYQLWSGALTRGSKNHTYEELTAKLENMAASLSAFSGKGSAGIGGSFLARDLDQGIALLSEVWLTPTFPADQVQKAKADQAAALRAQEDSPVGRAFRRFSKLIYGDHPYGLNYLGTKESLAALDRDKLLAAHRRLMGPGGCVLAVVGDVDPVQVEQLVMKHLGVAQGRAEKPQAGLPKLPAAPRLETFDDPKAKQTQIILGYLAPSADDPRRHALNLQEAILGGMGGELFRDLRDKRSLAYAVQPFYTPGRWGSVFGVYMAVGSGKEKEALAGLQEHLAKAREHKPGAEDLARAKNYLLGGMAIGLQSYAAQAATMAGDELLGLGFQYYKQESKEIEAVNAGQVLEVTRQVLDPNKLTEITQGPK